MFSFRCWYIEDVYIIIVVFMCVIYFYMDGFVDCRIWDWIMVCNIVEYCFENRLIWCCVDNVLNVYIKKVLVCEI